MAPSTKSVLSIGEEALAKSIKRLGAIDFFAVVSRKPAIADFKPVQVEVAVARLEERAGESDGSVQILRFANRVPLQFDKAACAMFHAIESVNWRAYGLAQPKDSVPLGPYIVAISVVSPFIKFKNASKETVDASDELVEEIRRALIQAGQKLSKHIRKEIKANELEEKIRHIEQFGPILVDALCRITNASAERKKKAEEGLRKLLGRDATATRIELDEAHAVLEAHKTKNAHLDGDLPHTDGDGPADGDANEAAEPSEKKTKAPAQAKGKAKSKAKQAKKKSNSIEVIA